MKVVLINKNDITGGAALAAYRLHTGLRMLGHESIMFVHRKLSNEPSVIVYKPPMSMLSRLLRRNRRKRIERDLIRYKKSRPSGLEIFSDDRCQFGESTVKQLPSCDVINLHWIARFVDYQTFFSQIPQNTPVVWTLHDMNAFTGGCHYDHGCNRFYEKCGSCPQLGSNDNGDLSRQIWKRKKKVFEKVLTQHLHIVTPSNWLSQEVKKSSLLCKFKVTVIPNGIDTEQFSPRDKDCVRQVLGIPLKAKVILFVAQSVNNRRKGFDLLSRALKKNKSNNLFLLSIGEGFPQLNSNIPHLHLGPVTIKQLLPAIYSAADIFVLPSLQDNLPNTVLESLACGTPVIGFDVGGIPDMVRPEITGLLVPVGDIDTLNKSITELLENTKMRDQMSKNCRRIAVKEYSLKIQANYYEKLYKLILKNNV